MSSEGSSTDPRALVVGRSRFPWRIGAIAVTAGLVAGFVAWIGCERAHDVFRPRLFAVPKWEATWMEPTVDSQYAAERKNAALASAILGCTVGCALALAGGLAAGTPVRGVLVGLGAQAVGLLVGALASFVLIPLFHPIARQHFPTLADDLWWPLFLHAGVWAAVGAVGGGAFAIGMGAEPAPVLRTIGLATAGALLAALVYQMIGLCLPPEAGATGPVARWPSVRLVATLLPGLMIAAGAALAMVHDPRPSAGHHRPGAPDSFRGPVESSSGGPR